jgi:hypothetical protein
MQPEMSLLPRMKIAQGLDIGGPLILDILAVKTGNTVAGYDDAECSRW